MAIRKGDKIPVVSFTTMTANGPEGVDSDAFFKGKKVALFSVPGAYTPTCSARHLPSYIEKADALKAMGIDDIACTAVNDIFVLSAWAKANDADGKVAMLADGNGNTSENSLDGNEYVSKCK